MRALLAVLGPFALAAASLACVVPLRVETHAEVEVEVESDVVVDQEVVVFKQPPPLVLVEPGLYVVANASVAIYYVDGYYWHQRRGRWHHRDRWDRPWVAVDVAVVPGLLVHRDPSRYVRYKPRGKVQVWREEKEYDVYLEVGTVVFRQPPALVLVEPGFYVVENSNVAVFYFEGNYWYARTGRWYRKDRWDRPWRAVEVSFVPRVVVRRDPREYVHYKRGKVEVWRESRDYDVYVGDDDEIVFKQPPPLVELDIDVSVVQDSTLAIYYSRGAYWHERHGKWYRKEHWDRPWLGVALHVVPVPLQHREHRKYVHFRPRKTDKVWREPREDRRNDSAHPEKKVDKPKKAPKKKADKPAPKSRPKVKVKKKPVSSL